MRAQSQQKISYALRRALHGIKGKLAVMPPVVPEDGWEHTKGERRAEMYLLFQHACGDAEHLNILDNFRIAGMAAMFKNGALANHVANAEHIDDDFFAFRSLDGLFKTGLARVVIPVGDYNQYIGIILRLVLS